MIIQKIPKPGMKFINDVKDTGQKYNCGQYVIQHRGLCGAVAQQQDQEIYENKYSCKTAFVSFYH